MTDIVYPIGPNRPDTLRWSLRALWHHFGHNRVWLVGAVDDASGWITNVELIPTDQAADRFTNQRRNLEAVLDSDVGESFVWWDDDHFILRDTDAIPLYDKGTLSAWIECRQANTGSPGDYLKAMMRCLDLLNAWGYDDGLMPPHVPMPVIKSKLAGIMGRAWADGWPDGVFKALYLTAAELPTTTIEDPKRSESTRFWSAAPGAWSTERGDKIRNRYWRRSPYETELS